jgi:hypothetical protein
MIRKVNTPEWLDACLEEEAKRRHLSVPQLVVQMLVPYFPAGAPVIPISSTVPHRPRQGPAPAPPGSRTGPARGPDGDYRGIEASLLEASSVVEVSSVEGPGKREHRGVEPPEQSSLPGLESPPVAATPPPARARPPKAPPAPDPDFDRFYAAYPRKKARAKAQAAWAKLKRTGRLPAVELVLGAVEGMRAEMLAEGRDLAFCPYPASWLNAEQWADDHRSPDEVLAEPVDPEALRQADRDRRREEETERVFQEYQRRASGLRLVEGGRG